MPEVLTANATVAIAGGGLLGRLLAWQLLEQGHQVSLYDAGSFEASPSAAWTAAGMISPISEAIDTEPLMYALGAVGLAQWPRWLADLSQAVPECPVQYHQAGSLIVAHHRDHGLLQQYGHDMQRQLPATAQGQWLDKQAIHALETDVAAHFQQGLLLSQEAHIDNRSLLDALYARIQALGGQCIAHTSVEVAPYQISIDEQVHQTVDYVFDCRGVGAKPQWQGVRGVRGEVLRVTTDEVQLQRPVRLLHPRYQLYIVPKPNHVFVIGATQIESEDRSPMSVQSALELNSALYTVNPAFAEARIIEMQANLRPALNDNRPRIQYENGLIRVNGLYRHGYLLAPVVIQHVLALLTGHADEQDFADILYQRYGTRKETKGVCHA